MYDLLMIISLTISSTYAFCMSHEFEAICFMRLNLFEVSQCLVVSDRTRQYELIHGSSLLRCQKKYHNLRGSFSMIASQPASHCLAFPSHRLKNCCCRLNLLHWSGWDFQPESSNPAVRQNACCSKLSTAFINMPH